MSHRQCPHLSPSFSFCVSYCFQTDVGSVHLLFLFYNKRVRSCTLLQKELKSKSNKNPASTGHLLRLFALWGPESDWMTHWHQGCMLGLDFCGWHAVPPSILTGFYLLCLPNSFITLAIIFCLLLSWRSWVKRRKQELLCVLICFVNTRGQWWYHASFESPHLHIQHTLQQVFSFRLLFCNSLKFVYWYICC